MKKFAQHLRRNLTPAEQLLWNCIRKKRLSGCRFRRQQVIDGYITDFCCLEKRLIIELDGNSHDHPERLVKDKIRQSYLEAANFRVLRFTNWDVEKSLEGILHEISLELGNTPHPSPPPQGGRGLKTHDN